MFVPKVQAGERAVVPKVELGEQRVNSVGHMALSHHILEKYHQRIND